MGKMEAVVQDWDVDPALVIEAAFAWARRNRHSDGPMPNMLSSAKYLSKALSFHLELPFEAIAERRSTLVTMSKIEEDYIRLKPAMLATGVDVHMMNSFPVEFRFALAATETLDKFSMKQMAPSVLELMSANRKVAMWMNTKGLKYESIAKAFNAH
jgi:hypothetical protein